jgi:hypothetical protein
MGWVCSTGNSENWGKPWCEKDFESCEVYQVQLEGKTEQDYYPKNSKSGVEFPVALDACSI